MDDILENFRHCRQKEIAYCAASCPFDFDIVAFIDKIQQGMLKSALRGFRDAVGFPRVAAEICHRPCQDVCPRASVDSSIAINLLEKSCLTLLGPLDATDYNLPAKNARVAIVGAGLSGLACALRLAVKKYQVDVFEAADQVGGALLKSERKDALLQDIQEQFAHSPYNLFPGEDIQSENQLISKEYAAVVVATGAAGTNFGLSAKCGWMEQRGKTGWFAIGALTGKEKVEALADGLRMGRVVDNFCKTGTVSFDPDSKTTRMHFDQGKLSQVRPPVMPGEGSCYNQQEMAAEAGRCLRCQCDFCRTHCDLTAFYNKWPLRIRDEIAATLLPGSSEVKATPAKRLISTCNQCGVCKETCPEEIDLGALILEGRRSMHRQGKMPWVFHDFWLRDMEFSNSEAAKLVRSFAGDRSPAVTHGIAPRYAFFPGCQLGASAPELVSAIYNHLLAYLPDASIFIGCCGAPAEWAGDDERHQSEIMQIVKEWEALGKPTLLLACPTCIKKFRTYLPDIPMKSLYEFLATNWADGRSRLSISKEELAEISPAGWALFDPCASIHEEPLQNSVRQILDFAGISWQALPQDGGVPYCCGYGGQPGVAEPDYVEFVRQRRISESAAGYIVYCINCRDAFRAGGKSSLHLLDLFFSTAEQVSAKNPTITQRRKNRIKLKNELLWQYWSEGQMEELDKQADGPTIIIPEFLKQKLDDKMILEDDIREVVRSCESSGRRVFSRVNNSYSGYQEIGYQTYWVEYTVADSAITVLNAYAHRIKIELEAVWNGKRVGIDL